MAIQYLQLFEPVQLGTSAASIYAVPTSPNTSLLPNGQVILANVTATSAACTLYAVPSAGSAGATNEFYPNVSIPPYTQVSVNLPQMKAGDALWALASTTAAINILASNGVIQS